MDWEKVNIIAKEAASTKDRQKIAELYEILEPILQRWARRFYEEAKYDANRDNGWTQDDYLQEFSLEMIELIMRYESDEINDFGKLLWTSCYNRVRDIQKYRHQRKRTQRDEDGDVIRPLSLDCEIEDGIELKETISDSFDVVQEVIDRDLTRRFNEIKAKALTIVRVARGERYAKAYELRLSGLNTKEIGEILGISHDNARKLISRSLQTLRTELLPQLVA